MNVELYKNALNNWEATVTNLKSQLSNEEITKERKKDIEKQIKNAQKEIEIIKEKLKEVNKNVTTSK